MVVVLVDFVVAGSAETAFVVVVRRVECRLEVARVVGLLGLLLALFGLAVGGMGGWRMMSGVGLMLLEEDDDEGGGGFAMIVVRIELEMKRRVR